MNQEHFVNFIKSGVFNPFAFHTLHFMHYCTYTEVTKTIGYQIALLFIKCRVAVEWTHVQREWMYEADYFTKGTHKY